MNLFPLPQGNNAAPFTAFNGHPLKIPVTAFTSSTDAQPVRIYDVVIRRTLNVQSLQANLTALRYVVISSLQHNRARARAAAERGEPAKFTEGDYVLLAREEFHFSEKLCLRWGSPRRITGAVDDYVYQVEDLRNGSLRDAHATVLKFYCDASLNAYVILSHVRQSEAGMQV